MKRSNWEKACKQTEWLRMEGENSFHISRPKELSIEIKACWVKWLCIVSLSCIQWMLNVVGLLSIFLKNCSPKNVFTLMPKEDILKNVSTFCHGPYREKKLLDRNDNFGVFELSLSNCYTIHCHSKVFLCFGKVSFAHKGYIYLIKNTVISLI